MAVKEKPTETDTGWAWVILAGSVVWNLVIGGTFRIYGIFFIEFQEIFNSSPSQTGLLGLVCGIASIIISPVAGRLSDKYSVRLLAMVGGAGATAGILLTAFAPNLQVAIFTYSVVFGISVGFMDSPVLGMVSKYFKRHLNLANGISFAGCSIGNLTLGHVMAVAIDTYTMRGALIILACFWLQTCVVGALMRPFVAPESPEPPDGDTDLVPAVDSVHQENSSNTLVPQQNILNDEHTENDTNTMENDSTTEVNQSPHIDLPSETHPLNTDENAPPDKHILAQEDEEKVKIIRDNSCGSDVENVYSTGETHQDKYQIEVIDTTSCDRNPWKKTKSYLQNSEYFQFLKNRQLILTLILLGCGYNSFYTMLVAFPGYMLESGLTLHDVAWFMFVLGLLEVPMRVIIPAIVDRCHLNTEIPLVTSYCIMGVAGLTTTFIPHFYTFMAYACTHAAFGGLSVIFTASLMRNCVGVENMGSAMGLAMMQLHVAMSLSSTVIGLMYQWTGKYANSIRLNASLFFVGVLLYIILHFTGLYKPRRVDSNIDERRVSLRNGTA